MCCPWTERSCACHASVLCQPIYALGAVPTTDGRPARHVRQSSPHACPPLPPGAAGIKSRSALDSPSAASAPGSTGPVRLSLANFMQSSPVAMQRSGRERDGASPPPPAWGGATGASPPARHASFREIQEQQQAQQPPPPAKSHGTSPPVVLRLGAGLPPWRPPSGPPAAGGASLLGTSPSGSTSLLGTSPSGRGSSFLAAPVPQHSKW